MKKCILILCFTAIQTLQTKAQFFALHLDSARYYSALLPYPNDENYRLLEYYASSTVNGQWTSSNNYYGNYYSSSYSTSGMLISYTATPVPHSVIKVYDTYHNLINTIALPRGVWLHENPPLKANDFKGGTRLLWPCLYTDTLNPVNARGRLAILELDAIFHPVAIHAVSYESNVGDFIPTGIVSMSNDHYIVGGRTSIQNASTQSGFASVIRFYKLDIHLNKYDSADVIGQGITFENNLMYDNKFVMTGAFPLSTSCSSISSSWFNSINSMGTMVQKVVTDTNFNIVDCLYLNSMQEGGCPYLGTNMYGYLNPHILRDGKAIALSSTKTYITGESSENCGLYGTGGISTPHQYGVTINSIFNNSNQNLQTNVISTYSSISASYANTSYPTGYNTTYAIKQPYIITVAVEGLRVINQGFWAINYHFFLPPSCNFAAINVFYPNDSTYSKKSKLVITKMDTLGNVIWTKKYGGNMTYFGRGIAFTNDGGCVISGCRYDSTSMYNNHLVQNFLLKLDENGNYEGSETDTITHDIDVGIPEIGATGNRVKVFPNPANTEIYFEVINENRMEMEIYNTLGQLLLSKKNYSNRSAVDISKLSKDLYFYKIKTSKNNYSGKFVKE